jgi:hypothetical protein
MLGLERSCDATGSAPNVLLTVCNRATIVVMRKATTIGFAVDEADRARLEHLSRVFGGGNRSAFLRRAMDVMERYELTQRLVELQAYGEERLAAAEQSSSDIPALVARALADPDPDAVAQAKLIVAGLRGRRPVPTRDGAPHPVAATFAELAANSDD